MVYTNFSLDVLKFELEKKEKELLNESLNLFTYNPRISELTQEIKELQEEISKRED